MRAVFQFPASITAVVDAPRAVSSEASPTRPLWAVTRRAMLSGGGGGGNYGGGCLPHQTPERPLDVSFYGFCRSKPTCLECGYLTIAGKEIAPVHRRSLKLGDTSDPYLENEELIQCWRKQWVEYDKSGFSGDRAILEIPDELEKNRRRCPFFFPYESGVPPAAHAERQNARHMTWFGVAGGGLMVMAVEFVKALFRWGQ